MKPQYTRAKILFSKEFIIKLKVLTDEFTVSCRECGRNIQPAEDYIVISLERRATISSPNF